ncbi:ABC transporter permease [Hirschia litorea]|uniref:ABC transporter permease n=1 Tax=Hirschia litorea TaxID=1199156 RepID=A0ABW2IN41_9PROT
MTPLFAAIKKEITLLGRDKHGLGLLFILPIVFILIMSLALQGSFESRGGKGIDVEIIDVDQSTASQALADRLRANEAFNITYTPSETLPQTPQKLLDGQDLGFLLTIPKGFDEHLLEVTSEQAELGITVSSKSDRRTSIIFNASVKEAIGRIKTDTMLEGMAEEAAEYGIDELSAGDLDSPIKVTYAYAGATETPPNAVQQNVPAWLVFSIFFVAIPFSNTFIKERDLGMQRRLRTTFLGPISQFVSKLIPYFVVNQIQVILMLAVGVFLVPLLGGEALVIQGHPLALIALSSSISFAALGLALFIAVLSRTTEQATMLAGLGNILLAAIGGIMVPKFVMPEKMQALAGLSPMSWGLDGFLELFLQNGNIHDISPYLLRLMAFGLTMLLLSWLVQSRQRA